MLPDVGSQTRMRQEGLDPNRVTPVGSYHPSAANQGHIEDMKRSIESRFASVSTPSNFLQAGLFNTLGNNPVTQMITAAGGAAGDVWDSLLSGPERQNKTGKATDPLSALNQHTKILNDILDVLDNISDYMHFRDSNRGSRGDDGKIGPKSGKFVKQPTKKEKKQQDEYEKREKEHGENKKMLDTLTKEKSNLAKEIENAKTPEEKKQLEEQKKLLNSEIDGLQKKVSSYEERNPKPAVETKDPAKKPQKGVVDSMMDSILKKMGIKGEGKNELIRRLKDQFGSGEEPKAAEAKPETKAAPKDKLDLLGKMLGKGFDKSTKSMEKFSGTLQKAAKQLSKTFGDTAKTIKVKSKPLADAIKGSETAKVLKMGKNAVASKFADNKIQQTVQNPLAKIMTAAPVAAAPVAAPVPEPVQVESAPAESSSSILDTATDVAEASTLGKALRGGASKAADWIRGGVASAKNAGSAGMKALRGGGAKALNAAKNAGGFLKANATGLAKTAGIAHLATSGIEAAYDSFNTGSDEYAKRNGLQGGESLASDLSQRALGTMQDFGNKITFGGADRLSNWMSGNGFVRSDYYQDKPKAGALDNAKPMESPSRASQIQQIKSDIDQSKVAPKAEAAPAAVIGSVNNVSKNTTILPSRHDVRNTDASFNRYLDRSLS